MGDERRQGVRSRAVCLAPGRGLSPLAGRFCDRSARRCHRRQIVRGGARRQRSRRAHDQFRGGRAIPGGENHRPDQAADVRGVPGAAPARRRLRLPARKAFAASPPGTVLPLRFEHCGLAGVPCPFDGVVQDTCSSCTGPPPDPNAAAGEGKIVQVVNDLIQVTNRFGAVQCGGPVTLNRLLRTVRRPDRSARAVRQHQPALQPGGDGQLPEPRRHAGDVGRRDPERRSLRDVEYVPHGIPWRRYPGRHVSRLSNARAGHALVAALDEELPPPQQLRAVLHRVCHPEGTDLRRPARRLPLLHRGLAHRPGDPRGPAHGRDPLSFFLAAVPGTGYKVYVLVPSPLGPILASRTLSSPFSAPTREAKQPGSSVEIRLVRWQHHLLAPVRRHEDLVHPRGG